MCFVGHNQLSGSLPANIGDRWATLRGFWVHNNSLDGALPGVCQFSLVCTSFNPRSHSAASLALLCCLSGSPLLPLWLSLCYLLGSNTTAVFTLLIVRLLPFDCCHCTASLASLSSLEALDLRRNLLGELVLTDIQNMPALRRCDLRDNLFSCPVSQEARGE